MVRLDKKIKLLWTKEWVSKLISLFLAVLLWYFVGGEDLVDKNVTVSVEVINMPKDLIISNKFKKEVEVTVRGPRSSILEMGQKTIPVQLDLSQAVPGTKVEAIENSAINVSRGVEVLRVQPSSVILSIDKLISKEFPINSVIIGNVTPGYALENLSLDPPSISITGPQTLLSRVDALKTVPINIHGMSESAQLQIPLDLAQDVIDLIGETSVTADINIGFDTTEKTIANVPVNVVIDGYLQQVEPAKVTVTLKIPKMIIKKNMNFAGLFTVTAIAEKESDKLKVQVVPSSELTVPLEIVAIEPSHVNLVSMAEPKTTEEPGVGATKTPEEVKEPAPKKVTDNAQKMNNPKLQTKKQ